MKKLIFAIIEKEPWQGPLGLTVNFGGSTGFPMWDHLLGTYTVGPSWDTGSVSQ